MKLRTPKRGFALVEVIAVVVLVMILASVGLAPDSSSIPRAREATLKEDLFRMRDAMDQYDTDKNNMAGSQRKVK